MNYNLPIFTTLISFSIRYCIGFHNTNTLYLSTILPNTLSSIEYFILSMDKNIKKRIPYITYIRDSQKIVLLILFFHNENRSIIPPV